MIDSETVKLYRQFRVNSPFTLVGHNAELALSAAKTLQAWQALEASGKVRITMEPEEESYFNGCDDMTDSQRKSLEKTLDRLGCYWVNCEYLTRDGFESADSIGMCVYDDPCDPFENCYVIGMMDGAIKAYQCAAYPVCP